LQIKSDKALFLSIVFLLCANVWAQSIPEQKIVEGKRLTLDRKMGNCLACHAIDNGKFSGNTAPPLFSMKSRFPDREKLVAQISNPLASNRDTIMPPFGLHGILTEDQIYKIVEYLYTL
jgi:sulfur-oxidizing protein SoxX